MRLINLGVSGSSSTLISYQTSFPAACPMKLGLRDPTCPLMEAHCSDFALMGKRGAAVLMGKMKRPLDG